jgi:YVTN family beta-propeller protein
MVPTSLKALFLGILLSASALCSFAADSTTTQVGPQADGRIVVPTNQVLSPAGRQTYMPFRPNDLAISPDGKTIAVLAHDGVLFLDASTGEIREATTCSKTEEDSGGSYKGIQFTPDGKTVVASNIGGALDLFQLNEQGTIASRDQILLKDGDTYLIPSGLELTPDGKSVFVTLCISNELAEVNLAEKKILRRIPVGNMPFDVCLAGKRAYVSNLGGALPAAGDTTGPSGSGKPVKVDPVRFIASEGTVSVVDLEKGAEEKQIEVGLHPSGMAYSDVTRQLFVANANSDTVSVIDTEKLEVISTISTRPHQDLIFGSAPNDLALSEDGSRLYVSNGTNNAVAVIELLKPSSQGGSRILGFIPTGWYPAGIAIHPKDNALWVANIKGVGSRSEDPAVMARWAGVPGTEPSGKKNADRPGGMNSHDHSGTVSVIPIPAPDELAKMTTSVLENNRMTESISALSPPREGVRPKPVPERHGEPSVFEHVVYIIKENRTYDQIFGDMPEGNGDPSLVHFGEEVTPNCHKLTREFVLLDNFYCSGVLSADGHQWATEAYATGYLERAFGGFPRSYPYDGGDALAYASSGFLWDDCLAAGKTFRTYGEFVKASVRWKDEERQKKGGPRFSDCYDDWKNKKGEIEIRGKASIASLEPYTCTRTIGFPCIVSDQYRADVFLEELKQYEAKGGFPNLSMILLPNDHTAGTRPHMATPRALVADNDLAIGRIVEAISKSKFWATTCILAVQDDPQAGVDHVDGHRTVALVVSPYTKRKSVISANYNQTGMVRTIELMLGLPPMNQLDSSAIPMSECFVDQPDLSPYEAAPNRIPLDEMNPEVSRIEDPEQRYWAMKSLELPLDEVDEAPEEVLNRILWHYCKGYDTPYPEQYAYDTDDE